MVGDLENDERGTAAFLYYKEHLFCTIYQNCHVRSNLKLERENKKTSQLKA